MKVKVNLSLDEDTAARLKQFALDRHTTVSQAVTDWIWEQKVKGNNIKGQTRIKAPKKP